MKHTKLVYTVTAVLSLGCMLKLGYSMDFSQNEKRDAFGITINEKLVLPKNQESTQIIQDPEDVQTQVTTLGFNPLLSIIPLVNQEELLNQNQNSSNLDATKKPISKVSEINLSNGSEDEKNGSFKANKEFLWLIQKTPTESAQNIVKFYDNNQNRNGSVENQISQIPVVQFYLPLLLVPNKIEPSQFTPILNPDQTQTQILFEAPQKIVQTQQKEQSLEDLDKTFREINLDNNEAENLQSQELQEIKNQKSTMNEQD